MSATDFAPDTSKEFNVSNLKATINSCNSVEGLKRYKYACEGAITSWDSSKHKDAEKNVVFFTAALHYTNKKLKRLTKPK